MEACSDTTNVTCKRPVDLSRAANDNLPYNAAVDISDLVHLEAVMEELKLGPNGGLVYCMDYLEENMDWLKERVSRDEERIILSFFSCCS